MGLLFVVFAQDNSDKNIDSIITRKQINFLNEVEINQTLRNEVLSTSPLPLASNELDFPNLLRSYFFDKKGKDNCILKICDADETCLLDYDVKGEIYLKDVIIHSNKTLYSPKTVSMICANGDLLSDYYYSCDDGLLNGNEFGIDCMFPGTGDAICPDCGICEGAVTFECEKLKENPCDEKPNLCNWTGSQCERRDCSDLTIQKCISGNGCYAVELE